MSLLFYSIALFAMLALSHDVFPEFLIFRIIFFLLGIGAAYLRNTKVLYILTVVEIVLCFFVTLKNIDTNYEAVAINERTKILSRQVKLIDCTRYSNQWLINDCQTKNEAKEKKNDAVIAKANSYKPELSLVDYITKFPADLVYVILSIGIGFISIFFVDKREEVKKENVSEERIINLIRSGEKVKNICNSLGIDKNKVYRIREKLRLEREKGGNSLSNVIDIKGRKKA